MVPELGGVRGETAQGCGPVLGHVFQTQAGQLGFWWAGQGRYRRPRYTREGKEEAWVPLGMAEKEVDLSFHLESSGSWFLLDGGCSGQGDRGRRMVQPSALPGLWAA